MQLSDEELVQLLDALWELALEHEVYNQKDYDTFKYKQLYERIKYEARQRAITNHKTRLRNKRA
jgi:hypothetical protein